MLVYRIENEKTEGPFGADGACHYDRSHKCDDAHSCRNPPGPSGEWDTPLYTHWLSGMRGYRFGFRSKRQLQRWFRSKAGRRAMAENGFRLSLYEVPDEQVVAGNWQVAFDLNAATLKHTLDLETLH